MPRDSINAPEVAGSVLQKNLDFNWSSDNGTVILHNGIPHVAWCERFEDTINALLSVRGPYVAAWTGSDWIDVAALPALPDFDGSNRVDAWPWADGSLTNPCTDRRTPLLASDGVNLYLAVVGSVMRRIQTNPGGDPPVYLFYDQSFIYGFRLDGDAWTTIGSEIFGVFPNIATAGAHSGGVTNFDISASEDNPGECYFVVSGNGYESFGNTFYWDFSVAGVSFPETAIDSGSVAPVGPTDERLTNTYSVELDGSGDTLTLYYQLNNKSLDEFVPNIVSTWSLTGDAGSITDTDLSLGYSAYIETPAAFTIDGSRYLSFPVTNIDTNVGDIVLKKVDPLSPVALGNIDARNVNLDKNTARSFAAGIGLFGVGVFVETDNVWLAFATSEFFPDGPRYLAQLDKQCSTLIGWFGNYPLGGRTTAWPNGGGAPATQGVLYEDAIWFFQEGFSWVGSWPDGRLAQVFRTPICRDCVPCPTAGLHVWQRV